MISTRSTSPDVRRAGSAWIASRDPACAVVWLDGEHDPSTAAALSETMARGSALDTGGLIVDLSNVQFMDASTVGAIVRVRALLRPRSLVLRSPSTCARRVLEVCGLADASDPSGVDAAHPVGAAALETWVAVPTTERAEPTTDDFASAPSGERKLARVLRLPSGESPASLDIRHSEDEGRWPVAGRRGS